MAEFAAVITHQAPACRGSVALLMALAFAALAPFLSGASAQTSGPASAAPPSSQTPALDLVSLDGTRESLAGLRGRPVLVHFFATWCEPCRAEMAGLTRFSERQTEAPFAILAVDVGEPETRIRRFFARAFEGQLPPFPILIDADRAALKTWRVASLPASYLLDADHTVRLTVYAPVDWDHPRALAALDDIRAGRPLPADFTLPNLPDASGSTEP